MDSFTYQRAADLSQAIQLGSPPDADAQTVHARTQFLAGGTTLLDLAKIAVMRPATVIDINPLSRQFSTISVTPQGVQLGALARMADVAADKDILRDYPVIAQALQQAASPQLRNMASLGGNVLQRTRCAYFRDPGFKQCNKREPGSGCAALAGVNRRLAVLGTSDSCIASYPGDFAQALVALDATVDLAGPTGNRTIRFEDLHRLPGTEPQRETTLKPGEIITGFTIPAMPWAWRSLYLKIRDRASYDFALASVAVVLDIAGGTVTQARIALGGLAAKPWRAREAEQVLQGKPLDQAVARQAAEAALAGAAPRGENKFKVELGKRTLVRALLQAAALEVPHG
jgi:xanthine dehydrogenase YagS FAD-binding subunit